MNAWHSTGIRALLLFTRLASFQRSALIKALFGEHLEAVVVNADSGTYVVDAMDRVVSKLLMKGGYGQEDLGRLSGYITSDSRVLVVGAHVGTIVFPLASIVAHVDAIEANPRTYSLLSMTQRVRDSPNVTLHNFAAGDSRGEISFLLSRLNSGGSKRAPVHEDYAYVYDSPQRMRIRSERLDDVFEGTHFDAIFMDIEGSEYFALKGMPRLLSQADVLIIEFIPHHLRRVAGVGVSDFLSMISPGSFSILRVPSKGLTVGSGDFASTLEEMMTNEEYDDGLIFAKDGPRPASGRSDV